MGSENRSQVLWKSNKCFILLSYLSSTVFQCGESGLHKVHRSESPLGTFAEATSMCFFESVLAIT